MKSVRRIGYLKDYLLKLLLESNFFSNISEDLILFLTNPEVFYFFRSDTIFQFTLDFLNWFVNCCRVSATATDTL